MQDFLTIGFEYTKNKDRTCLIVSRPKQDRNCIVNTFYDEQAEDLYTILMGNEDWKERK